MIGLIFDSYAVRVREFLADTRLSEADWQLVREFDALHTDPKVAASWIDMARRARGAA